MADWPRPKMPPPPILTPFHPDSLGWPVSGGFAALTLGAAVGTSAWNVNNLALAYPFYLHTDAVAMQLLFWVGAGPTGNVDVGIYDAELRRIVTSGTTAMGTANTVQELNITDTELQPGRYLLAVACSSSAATVFAPASVADELILSSLPVYEQTLGSLPLPNPLVPVVTTLGTSRLVCPGIQFVPTF